MHRRVHIWVRGRVQGVFFRATACQQARTLELAGWVRNLRDGRVEIVAEGEEAAVAAFLAWCKQGPPRARVDGLEVRNEAPTGDLATFEQRWDE